jgi:hypothetical protein
MSVSPGDELVRTVPDHSHTKITHAVQGLTAADVRVRRLDHLTVFPRLEKVSPRMLDLRRQTHERLHRAARNGPIRSLSSWCQDGVADMDDRAGSTFNPRTFLAKVGSGRTQTRYGKDEPIFAQGDVADAVFRAGKVGPADIWETYRAAAVLDGPNLEYVVDLLRRVSRDVCDPALLKELTEAHLRLLVDQANGAHGTSAADFRAIRRARRIARRALEVWERAHVPVDPDIRADVHLAYGSTFARPLKTDLATAIERYVIALQLKRAANESDVARVEDLLEQMLDHANMKSIAAQFLGGLGMAVRDLRAAYEAAIVVGREDLIVRSGLTLAEAYRGVGQPTLAEPLLRSLLDAGSLRRSPSSSRSMTREWTTCTV